MALRNIFSLGAVHGHSHADVNLAYAGLKELKLAAQDILLHRSDRHELPVFKELRLFSSQSTCTFSRVFTSWHRRFEKWQLESDRKYAAPEWWHDALWNLGRYVDGLAGAASSDAADDSQGDLRWRFFRAAGELKSITGCSLTNCRPIVVIHANLRETIERAWAR